MALIVLKQSNSEDELTQRNMTESTLDIGGGLISARYSFSVIYALLLLTLLKKNPKTICAAPVDNTVISMCKSRTQMHPQHHIAGIASLKFVI